MERPKLEVADILRRYGAAYRAEHETSLSNAQRRVMRAITACRTAALGGHVEACDRCEHRRIAYNSCRNRHCPKCQSLARAAWIEQRQTELLDVEYFHVVFTLPEQIAALAYQNKAVVYNLLFAAAAATLRTIAADPKHLGAEIGFFAVLHTWGQNLMHHPHLHCVAPGGGLSTDGQRWVACRRGFFLRERDAFRDYLDPLRNKEWIVYAKPPFAGSEQVLDYVGRYTHRVAISNNRLLDIEEGKVTFRWKDYRDGNAQKTMTLAAGEFIRRFLLHVLPPGLQRIRYYGFLGNRYRQDKLDQCRQLLQMTPNTPTAVTAADALQDYRDRHAALTGVSLHQCPVCQQGRMIIVEQLNPPRAPTPIVDTS